MSDPRKHHYVPQWHLRQWVAHDNRLQSYTRLADSSLSSRRFSAKSIAFETDLYSWVSPTHPERQQLEKEFFQTLDSKAALAASILREPGTKPLLMEQRKDWARFLTASILRLPLELRQIKNFSKETDLDHLQLLSNEQGTAFKREEWLDFISRFFPGFHEDRGLESLIEYLQGDESVEPWLQLQWWVEKVEGAQYTLLTSDRPLITRGIQKMEKGLLAFLPLSPLRLFCATNDPVLAYLISSGSADFAVNWSNNLQIKEARKYLFATDDSLKWHIEKHFGEGFPPPPLPE